MPLQTYLQSGSYTSWIGGKPCEMEGKPKELAKATTGELWKKLYPASKEQTEQAIEAAKEAFFSWSKEPAPRRGDVLRKAAEILLAHKETLAEVMALEMGKPFRQGKAEVEYSAGFFCWFAGEAERIYGQMVPSERKEQRIFLSYEPIGVCALLTPWNFPLAMPARKLAAALAAGCTAVLKPSSHTPVSGLILAQVCEQAGALPGVVNVVFGEDKVLGGVLTESSAVRKLSFTGSVAVGKKLYGQCAGSLKKLTLELGGHAPTIVYDDADLKRAVEATVTGKFRNNGQTCVCPNRIYVQKGIYDTFCKMFVEAVGNLKVGDPLDPKTDVSTVLLPSSKEKTEKHVQDAVDKGAILHARDSSVYTPKVLVGVTDEMAIYHEETFGPVAGLTLFDKEQEAIERANATPYGLASYVFTTSLQRAFYAAETLACGIVGINDGVPSNPRASFGGVKESGFGREGGPHGVLEYLSEKYVSLVP